MKKTWKRWLGTVAAALVTSTVMAQSPDKAGVVTMRGQSPTHSESGSLRSGEASASAGAHGIRQSQYVQSVDPGDVFEDALGGGYYAENGGVGFASTTRVNDILWRVGNQSLDAYGYQGGYTNINAFVPLSTDGSRSVIFLNPRVNMTDYREGGANIGLGYRFFDPADDRVYGVSGWWDYDAGHRGYFHQMGMNLESIGRWVSLRGGFSIPVGQDQHEYASVIGNPQFVGNQVVATRTTSFEQSYGNYNVEVSTPLPGLARYGFDIGTGMYILHANGSGDTVGTTVRTQAQVTEDLWINGTYSWDSQFKSQFSLNLEVTMPDGPPSQWFRRNPVQRSLTESVLRNYRVAVSDESKITTEVLTNPGGGGNPNGGQAISIAFIDPNATVAGNGSLALPFMSLAEYMSLTAADRADFDILYVRRNVDLTDSDLNTTVTLLDFQKMLGDGLLPDGSRPVLVSGQGAVQLPGTAGPLPLLSNSAASGLPVVTFNDGNEISGFTIDGTGTAAGIVGTGIDAFNIHDVFIQNVTDGIVISSNTTPNLGSSIENYGVIQDVTIDSSSTGALVASNRGISITHAAGTLDLLLRNNTVSGFRGEDANGNGTLDATEDTNNNGLLDVGEDIDFDGILDPAEDKNGNAVLDRGVGIEVVANGGTINAHDPSDLTRPSSIDFNVFDLDGNGLSLLANPGAVFNATVANNTSTNGTDPNGRAFEAIANGGTMNLFDVANNVADGGAGDGLVLVNQNGGTLTVQSSVIGSSAFSANAFTNNGGDGLKIIVSNASLTIADLSGITFNNNTGDGLELQALVGGTLNVTNPLTGSAFTNNGANGLNVNADGGVINIQIGDSDPLVALGNVFTGNGESGLAFNTLNNGIINTGLFHNTASNNGASGGDGIQFNVNTGAINLTGITNNTLTNNRGNGLSVLNTAGGAFATPFVTDNNFNDNDAASMFIGGNGGLVDGNIDLGSVTRNTFNRTVRGTAGILFDTDDVLTNLTLTRNEFIGGNANTTFGVGGVVRDGGLTMIVGTVNPLDANTFTNNRDAHIGLILEGDSVNTIEIDNATFTGAIDIPGTPNFTGDGVAILLGDTAVLTGHIRNSQMLNNAGDGARIGVTGNNDAGNGGTVAAQVNNFEITDNLFQGNGDDGLEILRTERGQFNNLLIENNIFDSNLDDGLFVNVSGVSQANQANGLPDTMDILSNNFTDNGGDGIEFRTEADADLLANLDLNLIDGNTRNGIYLSERVNDARDSRSITGIWSRNTITNNGFSGIQLQGHMGNANNDPLAGRGLVIGDVALNPVGTQSSFGNLISLNALDGIQITGGGVVNIGNNVITFNGSTDAGVFNNAGINVQGPESENGAPALNGQFPDALDDVNQVGIAYLEVRALSNLISQNVGDGVRFINESGADDFDSRTTTGGPQAGISTSLTLLNNEITQNQFRGINVLNRPGDTDGTDLDNTDPNRTLQLVGVGGLIGDLTIIGNHVKGNLQEGIYVVNTNATDQSVLATSNQLLSENGGVFPATFLRADIHNNEVIGNGSQVTDFPATGLVVRVGTTDGGFGPFFDGGFATTGFNLEDIDGDGILNVDLDGNGVLSAAGNSFGGISMSVTGNTFDGNFGDDVLFHSFRSTTDPATGTDWSTTVFDPTGYQSDPLSRMDLIYSNNIFSSMEANNLDRTIGDGVEPGAYYNNATGNFQSRTIRNDASTGPFGSASRKRNAQRLASRYLTGDFPLDPFPAVPPFSINFLYPGMGDSTFRVRGSGNTYTDQGLGAVLISDVFILDDPTLSGDPSIVDATFEANGVFMTTGLFGELPWGWGEF